MEAAGEIVRLAARGDGVTADGRHVPLSAPGDTVTGQGLQRGVHHQIAPCRHFPLCGGCQLQHVDDESYANFVRDRVIGALIGQGVAASEILAPHISPPCTRRRASLRAARNGKQLHLGFSSENSHRIVDMRECHILRPELMRLVEPLRAILPKMVGDKRGAHAKMTLTDQGVDLLLEDVSVEGLEATERLNAFAAEMRLARLSLDSGFGAETWYEPEPVTVTLGGVPVAFPPFAFLQATDDGEGALIEAVRPAIDPAATFADLFSGLGTFAFGLDAGKTVYAAEAARDLTMALKSAANRGGRRVAADHRDLFRRPLTPDELARFDAVLIDPPRAGAREQVMHLAVAKVPVVAYVSCNPGSFARDAKMLVEGGYVLESVKPVGQFRWSTHVELAAIFRR